jgi:NADH:ubiquinone oxidoreductase subunit 4 (subunit M)
MFFLVDCIQRRYKSRLVSEISGILHTSPNLGLSLLFMNILYAGIPGSIKFTSELYIYGGLFETAPYSSIILLFIANFLGLVGFSKCWFNVVFGSGLKPQNINIIDLTFKELFIVFLCIFCSFLFNYLFNLFV